MPSEALYWSLLLPISFGALFFGSYLIEPRRLINGLLFNLFAIAFLFDLAIWILSSKNLLLIAVMGTLFIIIILLLFALFALHLLWLIWNAIVVWRKESHSMGNMLTLFIALGLVVLELGATYFRRFIPDFVYLPLSFMIIASMVYILISLYNFLTILTIYNLRIPHYNQDYLIVLGAGLLNGDQVSPLLAARINAASKFYRKQVKKGRPAPKIIYSGGQGGDETVSEGFAMQQYAIKSGIPASSTMVEGESKTTLKICSSRLGSSTHVRRHRIARRSSRITIICFAQGSSPAWLAFTPMVLAPQLHFTSCQTPSSANTLRLR